VLVRLPKLRLQPHVHLLRTTHNVHEVRSALLTREDVPELRPGDFPLVLYRKGLDMRHWVTPLALWGILDAIGRGETVPAAIDSVFTKGWTTADELGAEIGTWFREIAERRLVSTVSD
jgi:hypothetical protein